MRGDEAVLDIEDARRVADQVLAALSAETGAELAYYDGAFDVPTIREADHAFVFRFNSVQYIGSGDILDQVLLGPIVVPKDGSRPWVMGTALSEDEQLLRRNLL